MRRWISQLLLERGGLIAIATLALYLALSPMHIVDGENAHFAALGAVGGAGHPSGYPLYILWLRMWSWLPGATPAHTAALATAVLGAAQIWVLHAACRAWGARPLAATLAVGMFAVAPVVLRIHTEAEVFALNGLIVAAVLWVAAESGPWRGPTRVAMLGLIAGLGMANHFTCALIAPVGLLGIVRGVRETTRLPRPVVPLIAVAAFGIGLLPYLYLLVAPTGGPSWGHVRTFGDLLDLALRRDYGGPFAFAPIGDDVSALTNVRALASTLGRTWLWVPGVVGLGVLGARAWRAPIGQIVEPVWGWRLLALAWLIAGPLLTMRFNIAPSGVGLYVVARFHILSAQLLTIPIALGFGYAGAWIVARTQMPIIRSRSVGVVVALVAIAAIAGTSLPHLRRTHTAAVEEEILNTLGTLPENAVVIGGTDELLFGFAYVQDALHQRPDVIYVNWPSASMDWYQDNLRAQGLALDFTVKSPHIFAAASQIFAQHRPLFVDAGEGGLLSAFPHELHGALIQIFPRGSPVPTLDHTFELNKELYGGFELGYAPPGVGDDWAAEVHNHYAATWFNLSQALDAAGRPDDAHWALNVANGLAPQPE